MACFAEEAEIVRAKKLQELGEELDAHKKADSEAYSRHVEEICDLRSQLDLQKGLENAVAQDLEQINGVYQDQMQQLQASQNWCWSKLFQILQFALRRSSKQVVSHSELSLWDQDAILCDNPIVHFAI